MNWDSIKKNIGHRVQLEPIAIYIDDFGSEFPLQNDDWLIEDVTQAGIHIGNLRSSHKTILGKDHVHHYTSNPARSVVDGLQYGFLTLLVQICIQGINLTIRPCARPGERLPPPPVQILERWVDIRYPADSGLQERLESAGYRVAWCSYSRLARRIELEGWEVVLEKDPRGRPTSFHIRTNPENQILIKTRLPDINLLASRANVAMRNHPGFVGCAVASANPPILAFRFSTPTDAVGFMHRMSTGNVSPFRYAMAPGRLDTVLEYR